MLFSFHYIVPWRQGLLFSRQAALISFKETLWILSPHNLFLERKVRFSSLFISRRKMQSRIAFLTRPYRSPLPRRWERSRFCDKGFYFWVEEPTACLVIEVTSLSYHHRESQARVCQQPWGLRLIS